MNPVRSIRDARDMHALAGLVFWFGVWVVVIVLVASGASALVAFVGGGQ